MVKSKKKEKIFLIIFIVILIITAVFILKNSKISENEYSPEKGVEIIKPDYLKVSIPKIDKIKTIINNPKFKEMKYDKEFFTPVEKGISGRVNPFMPFRTEQKQEE